MKHNPFVSIVLINFNNGQRTIECLQSLKAIDYTNYEIILVDNASTDDSLKTIEKEIMFFPKYQIIKNKENLGFASGCNMGSQVSKGEYILLLNNDTIVTPNFLSILVHAFEENKDYAIVQPKIIFKETGKLQSGCAFFTNFGFLYYFGFGADPKNVQFNKTREMFSANGACMLIRRSIIDDIGLFYDNFFAYYEETDFCHRVLLFGQKIIYQPLAVVYHIGGETSKKRSESFIFYHSFKNRLASLLINFQLWNSIRYVFIVLCIYFTLFFYFIIRLRFDLSFSIVKAVLWNLMNIYGTMKLRLKIQKTVRKVEDSYYLQRLTYRKNIRYYIQLLTNKKHELLDTEDIV